MVSQQAALITAHTEMVHKHFTRGRGLSGGVEGTGERGQQGGDIFVQIADFARHTANNFSLVGGKMRESLSTFGMLDLGPGELMGRFGFLLRDGEFEGSYELVA